MELTTTGTNFITLAVSLCVCVSFPNSVFIQEYYAYLGAVNLGVSGDQTQHLLWRIQNGELPDVLQPEVRFPMKFIFELWASPCFYMEMLLSQGKKTRHAARLCGFRLCLYIDKSQSTPSNPELYTPKQLLICFCG